MTILHKIRLVIRRLGFDVSRYPDITTDPDLRVARLLDNYGVTMVLDVGAAVGGFGIALRRNGYAGEIVSFEPLSGPYRDLVKASKNDRKWQAIPVAVGKQSGAILIHVAGNSVSSSVLEMLPLHRSAAPLSHSVGTQESSIVSLDDWAVDSLAADARIFLKVDVQGYEAAVLDGASRTLQQALCIQLEVSFVALYGDAPSYIELFDRMDKSGFSPVSISPVFIDKRVGQVLQADVVFARKHLADGSLRL